MSAVNLKANTKPFAQASVEASGDLVRVCIGDDSTRMFFTLELHPDSATALAQALLSASREASFTRLEAITKGGAA